MVNVNIEIFEMSYKVSISYFKLLVNLEKIGYTNGAGLVALLVDNKISVTVTDSVGKLSKNPKASRM
jgi:hypothetical protein